MRKPFDIATRALCCKQDIPEVEAIRRLLFSPLRGALAGIGRQMLAEINPALDAFETTVGAPDVDLLAGALDLDGALNTLMASLLVSFESGSTTFLPVPVVSLINQGTTQLLNAAADEQGVPRDYTGRGLIETWLALELRTVIRHLIAARRPELEAALIHFLRSSDPRTERTELELAALPESDLPRSREEFDLFLATLLLAPGDKDEAGTKTVDGRVDSALDIWAYSAFVVGEVEAGKAVGRTVAIAVAKVDGKTTKFCRWVNGRRISMRNLDRDIRLRRDAALAGNGEAIRRSHRFLDPNTARRGTTRQFAAFFRKAGLPPYHMGCRTHVRMIVPESV